MLTLEMPRVNRPGSTTASRLKQRGRETHDDVLDAGERRLVKSVERGEWTTVAGFRGAGSPRALCDRDSSTRAQSVGAEGTVRALRHRRPRVPAKDPEIDRALEAMSAAELRA